MLRAHTVSYFLYLLESNPQEYADVYIVHDRKRLGGAKAGKICPNISGHVESIK